MERVKIAAIYNNASVFTETPITVCGWARTIRGQKNFGFIELNPTTMRSTTRMSVRR